MTKHAIEGLTKAMAVELGPRACASSRSRPPLSTRPWSARFSPTRPSANGCSTVPLGRLGTPRKSPAVVFLASPAASLVTGSSLLADGAGRRGNHQLAAHLRFP